MSTDVYVLQYSSKLTVDWIIICGDCCNIELAQQSTTHAVII